MNEKHVAMWVYYTYRWHKDLPKWLQNDLERAKEILGVNRHILLKNNDIV
jgi:hypothetical protein